MQANRILPSESLTPEQLATLQTIFVFLESASVALVTPTRPTTPTDIELTATVRDLGLYCKDRLLTAFPALVEWRALGNGE
jgi:hypothetical protein